MDERQGGPPPGPQGCPQEYEAQPLDVQPASPRRPRSTRTARWRATARSRIKSRRRTPMSPNGPSRSSVPWSPGSPEQLAEVQRLLEQLHPYYETPLVEAMTRAAKSDLAAARGLKNLLVLTDGNDNRFRRDIPAALEETFRPLGIRVTVVYFHAGRQANSQELQAARNNFEKPLQRLEPPGRFVQATDVDQLIASLRAGLEQKLVCQILKSDKTPAGEEALEVTRPGGDLLRWWNHRARARHLHAPHLRRPSLRAEDQPPDRRPADRRAVRRRQRGDRVPARPLRRRGRFPGRREAGGRRPGG